MCDTAAVAVAVAADVGVGGGVEGVTGRAFTCVI